MSKLSYLYIGLGSNLGDKLKNIHLACDLIQSKIGDIKLKSHIYKSPPWGFESKDEFYNSVILVYTKLSPSHLLMEIKKIERFLGRDNSYKIGYSSRLIDIDIIDYNGVLFENDLLSIPHPHLHSRNFVLYPLYDINNEWIHPINGKSISLLIQELNDNDKIEKVII